MNATDDPFDLRDAPFDLRDAADVFEDELRAEFTARGIVSAL